MGMYAYLLLSFLEHILYSMIVPSFRGISSRVVPFISLSSRQSTRDGRASKSTLEFYVQQPTFITSKILCGKLPLMLSN